MSELNELIVEKNRLALELTQQQSDLGKIKSQLKRTLPMPELRRLTERQTYLKTLMGRTQQQLIEIKNRINVVAPNGFGTKVTNEDRFNRIDNQLETIQKRLDALVDFFCNINEPNPFIPETEKGENERT